MKRKFKVSEILEIIGNDGWRFARQKGSHRQHKHPSKKGCVTVSGKPSDTVPDRDCKSIFRQAGLDIEQYR